MGPKSSFLVCFMIRIFLRLFLPYKCLMWPPPVLHLFHSFHVLILLPQIPAPPQLRISGKLLSPGCLLLQHQFDLWRPPCRPRPATHATHTHRAGAHTVTGAVGSLSADRRVGASQAQESEMRNLGETQGKWTRGPGRNITWLTSKVNVPATLLACVSVCNPSLKPHAARTY